MPMRNAQIYHDIEGERVRQDHRWGVQRLTWPEWMSVLVEEVGEAQRAANQEYWATHPIKTPERVARLTALRDELIQSAAVAVAFIEHVTEDLDRIYRIQGEAADGDTALAPALGTETGG